jgi:ATP-dependent helicase/nuclease subunit B
MPQLFTVPAGYSIATLAAQHVAATLPRDEWPSAVMLVPNRRSCQVMRQALLAQLKGEAALLPRILPLAEIGNELVNLMGRTALDLLETIPPAMDEAQHRYLLASYVEAFERGRMGGSTLEHTLALTDSLMELQERSARHGVVLTDANIRPLLHVDFAEHWKQSLEFLRILTEHWPAIEAECGLTTAATREVRLMEALAEHWKHSAPDYPVYAIGSSASQPATAKLLHTIAQLPRGAVILPGIDPNISTQDWQAIRAGHPLYHLKQFLDLWPMSPAQVTPLANGKSSLWLEALAPAEAIANWRMRPPPAHQNTSLIPCAHVEEEVRVISLLLREGLENPEAQVALITPDEGLMARVAKQMQRYGIRIDRTSSGSLANTVAGSLWAQLSAYLSSPENPLLLRQLLHHPLLDVEPELLSGLESGWHGINRARSGQLPRHAPELANHPHYQALKSFVQQLADTASQRKPASVWVEQLATLIASRTQNAGEGAEAVETELNRLSYADRFGNLSADDFRALLTERLAAPRRDIGLRTHSRIHLLTPVEARLQHFDRVILANMQDAVWPGLAPVNPWLNLAAEKALGLPAPEEQISLMAHDVLMLGSGREVFLTYPKRDGGSPAARSRFIERLLTLLEAHRISEASVTAGRYVAWANARHASDGYAPEPAAMPKPTRDQRPRRLKVTSIEKLFSDPYAVYAEYVLGLSPLKDIDAVPEASDFGSLTHKAAERLSKHWDEHNRPATQAELETIAQASLRELSERPNIDIFWRKRLLNGLRFVDNQEAARRVHLTSVACEDTIEGALALAQGESMTLQGRIDRVETYASGKRIIDHKTGSIPTEKDICSGKAPQLLAYAIVMQLHGESVEAVEYWALPKRGDVGTLLSVAPSNEQLANMQAKLRASFEQLLSEETPLLAKPFIGTSDKRQSTDYDGISRYDEWAG